MKLIKGNSLWDAQFKKSISKVEQNINEIFLCLEDMQERLKELESQREQPLNINHNPSDIKENTPYGSRQS
jgi:phage shock protein A